MAKVTIVSITAGGGHKTAMYSLGQMLERFAPSVEAAYYQSPDEDLERTHRIIYTTFAPLYNLAYKAMDNERVQEISKLLFAAGTQERMREMRPIVEDRTNRLIISTHLMQTFALLKLKQELGSSIKIVAYVPDFDLSTAHFPRHHRLRADAAIAQNPSLLEKLHQRCGVARENLQQGGFIARPEFSAVQQRSPQAARRALNGFGFTLTSPVDENAFTLTATGGAYWVSEIYNEMKRLAESQKFNWDNSQLLVACGNNQAAFKKYLALNAANPRVKIIPLPFLSYQQMATLYRASDAVVLSGIAPATMYELLEVRSALPVIHRINPGPEKYNLEYARSHGIGEVVLDKAELVRFLESLSHDREKVAALQATFKAIAVRESREALERSAACAAFIERLAK